VVDRAHMMRRIQSALQGQPPVAGPSEGRPSERVRPLISGENLIDKFEEELKRVGGIARRAASREELDQVLGEICPRREAQPLVISRNSLILKLDLPTRLQSMRYTFHTWPSATDDRSVDASGFRAQCFSAAAGITGADYALAESGSLVLTSLSEGCQLASVAPPIHVALYLRNQVVETLDDVLNGVHTLSAAAGSGSGRSVVFVTGPSRTADIEQISIRGVHGPLAVYAVLIEDSCLK
jgi:L-lactate dehydrogenase complex protein LldG